MLAVITTQGSKGFPCAIRLLVQVDKSFVSECLLTFVLLYTMSMEKKSDDHNNFLTAKERKRLENRRKLDEKKAKELEERGKRLEARAPVGTPLGNKQRMQEFKDKLLNSVTGDHIIRKTIEVALNDEHPGQITALKMCMDRLLPVSYFEEKKDGSRTAINITISGIGDTVIGETIDNDGES